MGEERRVWTRIVAEWMGREEKLEKNVGGGVCGLSFGCEK